MTAAALQRHVLEALRAIASSAWHGKGCHRSNCGSVCLCAPCHARVAIAEIEKKLDLSRKAI
jgi:ferredoxin